MLQLCNRVTTLQACYTRKQSFSANQCVVFSCALLNRLNAAAFISFFVIRSLKFCTIKTHQQSLEMKIYRTASKSMIKTNGVQKVFFCLRIDSKYMNIVIDQRGKECLEVREKLAYDYNSTYNLLLLTKSYAPIFLFSYNLITLGFIIKKIFTENTKYSRKVTIGVWRSFLTSLLSLFFLSKQESV